MSSSAPPHPTHEAPPPPATTGPGAGAPVPTRARTLRRPDLWGLGIGALVVVVHAAVAVDARSLWLDEAYSLGAANFPVLSLSRTRGTMGLYYVLLWGWSQLGDAAWWLRLPSVGFALATLGVLWAVARRIGGALLAALAVPFLALSAMFEWKATEARAYSLETLIVALVWYVALRAIDDVERDRDLRWWLALVPLAVAGVFSHGLFVVHLAPVLLVAAVGPAPRRSLARLVPALVAAGAAALVLRSAGASEYGTSVPGGPGAWALDSLAEFLPGPPLARLALLAAFVLGLHLAVRRCGAAPNRADRAVAAVPVAWAVGPCAALAAISLVDPLYNPRYLAPLAPGLALLLAGAVTGLDDLRGRRPARPSRASWAVGGALSVALAASLIATPDPIVEDWRQAADVVAAQAQPGDGLVFANLSDGEPQQHRPPFEAAWGEEAREVTPTVISSARPLGRVQRYEVLRAPNEVGTAATDHDRIWVIDADTGGAAGRDAVLGHPSFPDLTLEREWSVPEGIDVLLYRRAD